MLALAWHVSCWKAWSADIIWRSRRASTSWKSPSVYSAWRGLYFMWRMGGLMSPDGAHWVGSQRKFTGAQYYKGAWQTHWTSRLVLYALADRLHHMKPFLSSWRGEDGEVIIFPDRCSRGRSRPHTPQCVCCYSAGPKTSRQGPCQAGCVPVSAACSSIVDLYGLLQGFHRGLQFTGEPGRSGSESYPPRRFGFGIVMRCRVGRRGVATGLSGSPSRYLDADAAIAFRSMGGGAAESRLSTGKRSEGDGVSSIRSSVLRMRKRTSLLDNMVACGHCGGPQLSFVSYGPYGDHPSAFKFIAIVGGLVAGTAIGLVGFGGRLTKLAGGLRPALRVMLDVDSW